MSNRLEACLLFDIDGTLIDTDRIHIVAFNEITSHYGVEVDEMTYKTRISGRINDEIFADILPHVPATEHAAIGHRKEALFRELAVDMAPIEGLIDLLDWADSVSLRYAAVTNAPRENAELVLRTLKATERFASVVLADDLAHAKPHPLPYLTGLQRLNGDVALSVAFEDSKTGVISAHAAGLSVIGMTTSLDAATLKSVGASLAAPDYNDPELRRFIRDRTGKH